MTVAVEQNHAPDVEKLKTGLAALLKEARINEEKLVHLQAMEMRLLNAENFFDVCKILIEDYRQQFNLRAVTLTLLDRGRQMQEFLRELQREDERNDLEALQENVSFVSDYQAIQRLESLPAEVEISAYVDERHQAFFGDFSDDVESVAILPLVRRDGLLGFLSLGSVDPERYTSDMATDFVDRLASIVAICVQNAIHLEQLKLMGLVDPLTQARNRRYFFKRMGEEIQRAQRSDDPIACLYVDLDHFKQVNDQYGHTAGDIALMHAVSLLHQAVRDSDVVARLGGEEFAVILPDTGKDGAVDVANRILERFRSTPCELDEGKQLEMTVSIGVSSFNTGEAIAEPSVLASKLVDQADKALYQAKNRGRDCVVVFQAV